MEPSPSANMELARNLLEVNANTFEWYGRAGDYEAALPCEDVRFALPFVLNLFQHLPNPIPFDKVPFIDVLTSPVLSLWAF